MQSLSPEIHLIARRTIGFANPTNAVEVLIESRVED
jgi:hypothetical protein